MISSCTQEQDLEIPKDELQLIRTYMEGELAGKSTFDNQPLEMDWKNAVVTKEHYEIPLLRPLLGFVPKYQDVETRLLVPNGNMEKYSFMTLDTEEIIGGLSFIELTSDPDKTSLDTYRHMNFSKDLQPGDFVYKRATASDPNAYMPVQCEPATIIYYEKDCYIIASTLVNCSEWREVERVEIEICGPDGIIGGNNYKVIQIDMKDISECHQDLIRDLIGGTNTEIKKILNMFNDEATTSVPYNLKFQYGNCGTATACTSPQITNNYAIVSYNQSVISNATDLSMARSTMHEVLHAYLVYELEYPNDCDLNCLLNDYIAIYGGEDLNPVHHNLFVETKFLNDIAVELKNYASSVGYNVGVIGDQYFKDMAWGGLHDTDVFKNTLTLSEQQRINNRYNAELNNTNVGNIAPIGTLLCD
ncbi:hypothetical protein [Algoriphagus winogradskyi]|uniref:Uncharacterized protein n=2 Tax=Algoriphagus winogradskyi TaxID=237017 RepID=A0ABY1P746_9BACT|nr:hypothetical protein [Algoriphagus winogradskyi]SMP27054.1 hypothetical protein SAMN06265367_10519 [Algoriphagus winogradskyi]